MPAFGLKRVACRQCGAQTVTSSRLSVVCSKCLKVNQAENDARRRVAAQVMRDTGSDFDVRPFGIRGGQ
jgi:phage FluMu protein Com